MSTDHTIALSPASPHFFPTHRGAQLRYIPGLRARGILTQVLTGTPKWKKDALSQPEAVSGPSREDRSPAEEIPDGTPIQRAIRRQTLRLLFDQMDCIIVTSSQMQDQLRALGVAARMELIASGVDLTRFRPARDAAQRRAARQSLGISDERQKIITTVGAVHPRKGSDRLLEAWSHLAGRFPETHIFIVGLRKDLTYPKLADFRERIQHLSIETSLDRYAALYFALAVKAPNGAGV